MTRALSSRSGRFAAALPLAALLLLTAAPAWAADQEPDRGPGWIPYIDASLDLHQDDIHGEISTAPAPSFTRFEESKNYRNTPLGFIVRLGVLTPALADDAGKPRMFMNVGVYATPETKETIIETGSLDQMPDQFGEAGRGSRMKRRFTNPAGVVGLGTRFVLPWVDERFRISPSIEYQVEKIKVEGEFNTTAGGLDFIFDEDKSDVYHTLGLGLEGEFVVTGGLSLFLNTRLLWLLSEDTLTFSNDAGSVVWTYERNDSPVFSGAFGFRYSFLGF
jgi:hypothetical protein